MNSITEREHCSISVVVPVYGSGQHLEQLAERVESCLQVEGLSNLQFIFVDDCGSRESWKRITALVESRTDCIGIELLRNFGQHNALMCGFQHATGDIVVTLDDDLQHEPESIPKLLGELHGRELDLVYGVFEEKKHSKGRNLGSWLVNRFYRIVFRSSITVSAFRAIRIELVKAVLRYDLNFTYIDGLLAWNSQRVGMVEVPHHERADGESGYTISKLVSLAMNVFTNFHCYHCNSFRSLESSQLDLGFCLAVGIWLRRCSQRSLSPATRQSSSPSWCLGACSY